MVMYMPYKRRGRRVRRGRKRNPYPTRNPRFVGRKYRYSSGISRQLTQGVHFFKRSINSTADVTGGNGFTVDATVCTIAQNHLRIVTGAVAGTTRYGYLSYNFMLNNLPDVSEFTNLFDMYYINKVVVKLYPLATSSESTALGSAYGNLNPILHHVIDEDGFNVAASEANIQTMMEHPAYRVNRLASNKPIKISLRPRTLQASFGGGAFGSTTQLSRKNQWIDCAYPTTLFKGWYGVVEITDLDGTARNFDVRMETTYYMKFKGPR